METFVAQLREQPAPELAPAQQPATPHSTPTTAAGMPLLQERCDAQPAVPRPVAIAAATEPATATRTAPLAEAKPTTVSELVTLANTLLRPELQIAQMQGVELEKAVGGMDVLLGLLNDNLLNEVLVADGKLGWMQIVVIRRVLNKIGL